MYFDKPGKENTRDTIVAAYNRAKELGIKEMVVATTTGDTAMRALDIAEGMKVTAVSYHAGFKKPFELTISPEAIETLEKAGAKVVCATHALSGVERGIAKKMAGVYPVLLVAQTLKMFGQGLKVAVEVSIMAADSGALSGEKIVALGGSSKGCDTAIVMTPVNQSDFFDIKIHEIICKPNLY